MVGATVAAPVHADLATAFGYLETQQNADGSISSVDDPSTAFQATSEVLRALAFTGTASTLNQPAALASLEAEPAANTEYLARRLVVASAAGADVAALTASLLARQDAQGGFGDVAGDPASVLDTAYVLDSLAESGQSNQMAVVSAVAFMLARQSADGGWAQPGNPSSIHLTAVSMRALWHYRVAFAGVGAALDRAEAYLLGQRDPVNGLWPELFDSALALIALVPKAAEFAAIEPLLTALESRQQPDGSWQGSVYTTALAIRALASRPVPQPPAVAVGSILGRVIDQSSGSAVPTALASIDALALDQVVDSQGGFRLDDLDPADYSVRISAAGYQSRTLAARVIAGTLASLGDIALVPAATTGVLSGEVSDSVTGQALPGALVVVSGAAAGSTLSAAGGAYSITDLSPGEVTVTITRDGYLPTLARGEIQAGGTLVFSPAMQPALSQSQPLPGVADSGVIRGTVTEAAGGAPVASAFVRIEYADASILPVFVSSAGDGSYQVDDAAVGPLTITVTRSGFIAQTATGTLRAGQALVYNPTLVALGGDPATGGGTVDEELLAGTPTVGAVQGRVSDAETGLPLAGALVELTGANSATALSAADGTYGFVDLVPGAADLQVSLAGYLAVSASGEVAAGSRLVFDPSLTPEGAVPVGNGGMSGRVIGADSGNPLLGVAVSATGSGPTAEPIFLVSGVDGRFDFTALPADAYTLSFEQSDRVSRSFSVLVTSGAVTDVGTIALSRAVDGVSIFGQVSDFNTGDPIPRAVVSALGSTLSSLADEAGRFRLDGLETGASTLYFSATGYASQTFLGRFEQNGEFEVNRALTRSTASGLQIEFLASDQPVYGAFDPAVFQANVRNNGNPLQAAVNLSVFDANDRLVTVLEATSTDTGSNRIDLPTGATVATTASMNTADLAPGRYRVLARVEVGDQLVGPATAILAERTMEFDIEPERTLAGLELNFATPFSAVGSTTPLELIASLSNRSNVPYQLQFNFSLRDEQNQSVFLSPLINVPVTPEQDTLLIPIDPITPTLQRSGEHRLVVSIFSQPRGPITTGTLSVAPALRIDPSQSLQPSLVTPDENKRIRVNIRLQGREVQ